MNALIKFARRLRHAPGVRRWNGLWRLARPIYLRALDPFARGVRLKFGQRSIRVPAELVSTNADWSSYEPESFDAMGAWLESRREEQTTLLDVGCSYGLVTSFALQISPQVRVFSFDSDVTSLRAVEAVIPNRSRARVQLVNGLLGDRHASGASIQDAAVTTLQRLPPLSPRDAIVRAAFLCMSDAAAERVPHHSLDGLFQEYSLEGRVLLKIDVEGAELLVLRGATHLLKRVRPTLLLSVHPRHLQQFQHSVGDISAFLDSCGYVSRVIARDHEEHWWCEPRTK